MKNFKLFILLIISILIFSACSNNTLRTETKPKTQDTSNKVSLDKTKKETEGKIVSDDIAQKTKAYILNGQDDKIEADKLKWSEAFLDRVNIEEVYQGYLSEGGTKEDIQSFAQYLTLNAPVLENWQELFATDLMNSYNEKISRIEHLENELYQVYVTIDGKDVPYVVVNARTGYFHG